MNLNQVFLQRSNSEPVNCVNNRKRKVLIGSHSLSQLRFPLPFVGTNRSSNRLAGIAGGGAHFHEARVCLHPLAESLSLVSSTLLDHSESPLLSLVWSSAQRPGTS
jgi:hypothetical protein